MSIKSIAVAALVASIALPVATMAEPAKPAPAADAAKPGAAAPDVVVKVNGLVCDFCARSLEKTFLKTGKVSGVAVDLTAKEVRLTFAPGANIDDATITKLVKDAGYAVVGVRRRAA